MDSCNKFEQPRHPRANANIFEILTFSWLLDLFKTGRKRDLEISDLYTNLSDNKSSTLGHELEKKWRLELINAKQANRKPSLLRALIRVFGLKIMIYGIVLSIGEIVVKLSQPLFIGGLLAYFTSKGSKNSNLSHAYYYTFGLTLSIFVTMMLYHSTQLKMLHIGMQTRVACCSAIFKKALRLSKTSLGETTIGQIVNLLSNDTNRFDTALLFLHFLWISPLQISVATYFIWQEVGVSSIFGLVICFMFIPLQGWLGKKSSEFRMKTALRTDERVCIMSEIISGIQVIKMYTWEKLFAQLIQNARKKEIQQIRGSSYIKAILSSFVAFHTKISLFVCIFSYVLLGNNISTHKVFVVATYYNLLLTTMTIRFPQGIVQFAELLVSIKRIQDFLLYQEKCDEVKNHSNYCSETTYAVRKLINNNGNYELIRENNHIDTVKSLGFGLVISNATAKWTDAQNDNSIEKINLNVKAGELVTIIGPVGAGKSSLMQAILQELPLSEGNIVVHGLISYASQEPWLFGGSVQQNILFGLPMDLKRYAQVVNVCALRTDFEQFPYGDRTIVGERGVFLSGGQKARINLARAVYKQADIYLLDDPLSAVDTHVGKHLFEKCIKGYLKDKTCILITHQLQYLTSVNKIVLMDNANLIVEGTYEELQVSNLDFTRLLRSSVENALISNNESNIKHESNNNLNPRSIFDRRVSIKSNSSFIDECKFGDVLSEPIELAETRCTGNISHNVYLSYISAGGSCCKIIFFICTCVFTQIVISGGDLWITYWVNLEEHVFNHIKNVSTLNNTSTTEVSVDTFLWWTISQQVCANVFAGLTLIMIIAAIIRSATFVSVCMRASMTLHMKMYNSISRATMLFFNTNASGRILNRFSKDIRGVDDVLPENLMDTLQVVLTLTAIVTIVGIINIYLMIPTIVIACIFYNVSKFYLSTSRSIKRLEGITRSPVLTYFNETLNGLTTIRAFEAEQILSKEFDNHQDLHSTAWYLCITSNRAFGMWLDVICIIYMLTITLSFILFGDDINGGSVGLAITQVLGLVGWLQWGVRQSTELENEMTSAERVLEYTNIPPEFNLETPSNKKPPTQWPLTGQITFKNFFLRYGPNTPYVIKNLNVNIESTQKVGIVGRTGAGKSSLIGALFRLALNEGNIIIDNIEIHQLGLYDLRSKISIIPQEPILFTGTIRTNLDPFDEYADHILWNALDNVELKCVVENMTGGLNSKMSEGGSNFSIGQRQLVCLARAIVRNNKILVLDEATANVDPQTDALIQNTIRNKFRSCTVLTIAHRLDTVMDSDKVLVMDAGKMVEFDHPYNLLKNKEGFLYKMVEQTGLANAEYLYYVAAESYKIKQTTRENPNNL